jgi:glycine cleavage system aminomethyltransferase T
MSPTLEKGIAMAYLSPPMVEGPVEVGIRDRWVPAQIKKPPFHIG